MTKPRIGIVLCTTGQGRFANKPAAWIRHVAETRADLQCEMVDLRDYPMLFFDEPDSPARLAPRNEVARRWARKIAELDGFIFVTAGYNHAVLKNALDHVYRECNRKPAAYLGYGGLGAARAVQELRLIHVGFQMVPVRSTVHIGSTDFIGMVLQGKSFAESPHLVPAALAMLDELAWWTHTLKRARTASEADATVEDKAA